MAVAAWAQPARSYPTKPVRVVIPWPAGGLTDVAGRIVFQKMSETLGQPFVIDMTPEQTEARIRSDYEKYGKLIKLTGVRNE